MYVSGLTGFYGSTGYTGATGATGATGEPGKRRKRRAAGCPGPHIVTLLQWNPYVQHKIVVVP